VRHEARLPDLGSPTLSRKTNQVTAPGILVRPNSRKNRQMLAIKQENSGDRVGRQAQDLPTRDSLLHRPGL
jgi:hypothetical protein